MAAILEFHVREQPLAYRTPPETQSFLPANLPVKITNEFIPGNKLEFDLAGIQGDQVSNPLVLSCRNPRSCAPVVVLPNDARRPTHRPPAAH